MPVDNRIFGCYGAYNFTRRVRFRPIPLEFRLRCSLKVEARLTLMVSYRISSRDSTSDRGLMSLSGPELKFYLYSDLVHASVFPPTHPGIFL